MNTINTTFPGFVTACGHLYKVFLPISFILLLIGFIYEFWSAPPSAFGMMKFILKLFLVVMLIANSNTFITSGQTIVQDWVKKHIPARPENVAAEYRAQLDKAQNAPAAEKKSFWKRLFSSNFFESIIYAILLCISWLAMAAMWFIYAVHHHPVSQSGLRPSRGLHFCRP